MYKIHGDYSKDDFFKMNPELSLISEIANIKSRKDGSKIMWAIFLVEHPDSRFYNIGDISTKRKEVEKNYLQEEIDWERLEPATKALIDVTTSDNKRSLKIWKEKAQELDQYVKSLDFEKNSDILLKLFKEASHTWKTLAEIETRVNEETKELLKGKGNLSSRERRFS